MCIRDRVIHWDASHFLKGSSQRMKLLNQILRGVVIGVANIIPGVSGGTMMVLSLIHI